MNYMELAETLDRNTEALEQLSGRRGALVEVHEAENKALHIDPEVAKAREEVLK
jgi:hypothetical protein